MSSQSQTHYPPTAESTLELLTEGQRLKQRLREQYAAEIDAALSAKEASSMGDYYSSGCVNHADSISKVNESLLSNHSKDGTMNTTNRSGAGSSSPPTSPSRRDLISASSKAIADAEVRERRLKALIDAHDPIRASLKAAQEQAMKSLIDATESSLAWEIRLAAEESDPFSPVHEGEEEGESNVAATSRNGTSGASTLQTSPFRDGGSQKEKELLEKRLGLLLKLQTEHEQSGRIDAAIARSGVFDQRNRYVEEAVDVVSQREMERQQIAKRLVATAVSDSRFESIDVSAIKPPTV